MSSGPYRYIRQPMYTPDAATVAGSGSRPLAVRVPPLQKNFTSILDAAAT